MQQIQSTRAGVSSEIKDRWEEKKRMKKKKKERRKEGGKKYLNS